MDNGSSPRVRGTRADVRDDLRLARFIPARAGNSRSLIGPAITVSVHPRACGELRTTTRHRSRLPGSSPRVRGTQRSPMAPLPSARFIPARAGNSLFLQVCCRRATVHPRACGELSVHSHSIFSIIGSSPRVRGTPNFTSFRDSNDRFIPARAGNSWRPTARPGSTPVHPRACGELT